MIDKFFECLTTSICNLLKSFYHAVAVHVNVLSSCAADARSQRKIYLVSITKSSKGAVRIFASISNSFSNVSISPILSKSFLNFLADVLD